MERYFIVFYEGINGNKVSSGNLTQKMVDGLFVNRIELGNFLRDTYHYYSVSITNIVEVSKNDYEQWNKQ